jgi:hypothetical protein
MELKPAEGSAAVRLKIPAIRMQDSFGSQREAARIGIDSALELLAWFAH